MRVVLAIGLLVASATAVAADKPAAVQICVKLPSGIALYSDAPKRNYRAQPDGTYLLDLDVTLNGKAPERVTPSGAGCLRAWLRAEPVSSIGLRFDRTDLNLKPETRAVKLMLKPDLWYDGGSFEPQRGSFSQITTSLPGKLEVARLEESEWSKGAFPMREHGKLPSGRYLVTYEPPPPALGSCEITVRAEASGTIRPDNRPQQFQELVETYRRDYAPEVASKLGATCNQAQALEVELRIVDGVYRNPWSPRVVKITRPEKEKRFEVVVDGARTAYRSGLVVEVGYGQVVAVEEERSLGEGKNFASVDTRQSRVEIH